MFANRRHENRVYLANVRGIIHVVVPEPFEGIPTIRHQMYSTRVLAGDFNKKYLGERYIDIDEVNEKVWIEPSEIDDEYRVLARGRNWQHGDFLVIYRRDTEDKLYEDIPSLPPRIKGRVQWISGGWCIWKQNRWVPVDQLQRC